MPTRWKAAAAEEWIEIKLTADSGMCESVMHRGGPYIGTPILIVPDIDLDIGTDIHIDIE